MTLVRALTATLLAGAIAPAGAHALAVDRVVAESTEQIEHVAVGATAVAWEDYASTGAIVHVRVGDGPVRDIDPGRGSAGISLGRDEHGRQVLAFPQCSRAGRCAIRLVDLATGRARTVRGIGPGKVSLPVVHDGRVAWADDDRRILVRSLRGGPVTAQFLGKRPEGATSPFSLDAIAFDGRRIAFTGDPGDGGGAEGIASELRVAAVGSRRVRSLRYHGCGEEVCDAVGQPVLAGGEVDALETAFDFGNETSTVSRYFGAGRKPSGRDVGADVSLLARAGRRVAYVTSDGTYCGDVAPTKACARVVLAGADPFGAQERLLAPAMTLDKPVGRRFTGRLTQTVFGDGHARSVRGVTATRIRLVQVMSNDDGSSLAPTGSDAVTDADGRFAVDVAPSAKRRRFIAYTVDAPLRTYSDEIRGLSASTTP